MKKYFQLINVLYYFFLFIFLQSIFNFIHDSLAFKILMNM